MSKSFLLSTKTLLRLWGDETKKFLQNLLTKDVEELSEKNKLIYAFLLNPKGRINFDLFIYKETGDDFYFVETDSERIKQLIAILNTYKLRSKVKIEGLPNHSIIFSTEPVNSECYKDPRVNHFGYRSMIRKEDFKNDGTVSNESEYLKMRLSLGIPEGTDLIDQIPLNMNGDIMNAINFEKGCYIGQELVSRSFHTGVVRRRVLPFKSANNDVKLGHLYDYENKRQGRILNFFQNYGITLTSLDNMEKTLFDENHAPIDIYKPKWWPIDLK